MNNDYNFWRNKKVLITGHTGFKGSWLSLLLYNFGAKLYGYSLRPENGHLFQKAKLSRIFAKSIYSNILNYNRLSYNIKKIKPQIIFHLAAQPLVVDSYKNPKDTFNVNVIGTLNLLESIKKINTIKTVIIITTDKVYKIKKNDPFYSERDNLGASDPYGTSKTCVELVSESYKYSYFKEKKPSISTARAGNVIGGGDYSKNRIVPDYLDALNFNKTLLLRNPGYIRPWQYVLEPVYGYTLLAKKKFFSKNNEIFDSWNFAPNNKDSISVKKLVNLFQKSKLNRKKIIVKTKKEKQIEKETSTLKLSALKSKKKLNWRPKFSLPETVDIILNWNQMTKNETVFEVSMRFVKSYINKI